MVAQVCHFSPSYFSSWFKLQLKDNFNHYLTSLRMRHAAEELRLGNKICDVAASVGYSDVKYFSRVFKQFHLVTAEQYKRMLVDKEHR